MIRHSLHIQRGLGLTLVILAAAAAVVIFLPALRPDYRLARQWQAELDGLSDEQLQPQLERIAELGKPGIEVLVQALGSRRPALAQAARRVVFAEFADWQVQSLSSATPRVQHLAERLADEVASFEEAGRQSAASLAMRILQWPARLSETEHLELIAQCETVLRAAGNSLDQRTNLITQAVPATSELGPDQKAGKAKLVPDLLPPIPGGNVPVDLARIPAPNPPREIRPLPVVGDPQSDLVGEDEIQAESEFAEPALLSAPYANRMPRHDVQPPVSSRPVRRLNWEAPLSNDTKARPANHRWQALNDREMMQQLHNESSRVVQDARQELLRRGFTHAELPLAKLLGDPDPQGRIQLTRVLPGSKSATRRWWLWLSEDADPRVRSATITILATTSDPQLKRRLRRMQLGEPDQRLRQQISRILDRQ